MNRGRGRREWCSGQEREGETLHPITHPPLSPSCPSIHTHPPHPLTPPSSHCHVVTSCGVLHSLSSPLHPSLLPIHLFIPNITHPRTLHLSRLGNKPNIRPRKTSRFSLSGPINCRGLRSAIGCVGRWVGETVCVWGRGRGCRERVERKRTEREEKERKNISSSEFEPKTFVCGTVGIVQCPKSVSVKH
jgi:hypothetical protein